MKKKRLAIISSHPIQYNAPMFAMLAKSAFFELKVFYTWSQTQEKVYDRDFGKEIKWDIPLLNGYDFQFVQNISKQPGPGSFRGIDCPDLIPAIRNWQADAVLVFGWNYKAHLAAMRHFHGKIPVVFRGDSTLIDESTGIKKWIRRLVLTFVYRYCDKAFYVGRHNKAYFLQHGFKEHQLFFAPHAIDNERFNHKDEELKTKALDFRQRLGIDQQDIVILFVGKFEPKKDPLLLMKSFQHLNRSDAQLIFAGNGFMEHEMKKLSEGQHNIHFIPFQNQQMMPVIYHLADLLALPSQGPGETWGLVVNEAMACGKAVLVSDKVGCAPDLIKDEWNGKVFHSGDLDDCVRSMQSLLSSKERLTEMGLNSRTLIESWSFEKIVESFEKNI